MEFKFIELEKQKATRIIYFHSPPANGLNLEVVEELARAIDLLKKEAAEVRCLILASRIENMFIAGADIKMIRSYMGSPNLVQLMVQFNTCLQETINEVEALSFPVVACINGHAMGGGLELALACDFRFMAQGKARLGLPEGNLGLFPGAGGTQRLPRLVGKSQTKDIIFNVKFLPAEDALDLGMVDRIFPPESLMAETLKYAEGFQNRAAVSIAVVKMCINQGVELSLKEGLALEMKGLERLLSTADAREGVTAFLEKRKPIFQGK
jgi:enoyl-CoA hydratase